MSKRQQQIGQVIEAALREEIRGFSPHTVNHSFADLKIDSFGLLLLRARVEQILEIPISDHTWATFKTPAQLLEFGLNGNPTAAMDQTRNSASKRHYKLNMPQMAVGGLSESWLVKELGDLHWTMIMDGLGVASNDLSDGTGERLYATITRLRVESTAPISRFSENENVAFSGEIARYGAGMYFSDISMVGNAKTIRATMMSSFAKRGISTSNAALHKGQPTISPDCAILSLNEMPAFCREYQQRRSSDLPAPIFECPYEILPIHDINGVGLLYFAAYPAISDICELRYIGLGNQWAARSSTVKRDIYYFANSDLEDQLIYRVHARRDLDTTIEIESSISRRGDGTLMAFLVTKKELIVG